MRTLSLLTSTVFLFMLGQIPSVHAQDCPCPNGNNANGPFISGASMTPTVACYEDLLALINGPLGNPMTVSAFDATDGFVPVCIVSAPPSNNCVGSIMIMVDAQDNDGNCASNGPLAITVIIQDNLPPVITCPGDVTIECDESLDPMVNGNLGEATALDNCTADVTISYSDVTISVTPCETVIERTWSAEDCGGTATCVQEISIQDTQAPTFTVPADIMILVDANCSFNADISITGDVTDESDNCDPTVEATFVDVTNPGSCVGETIVLRTWTSTDDCGNSLQQVQTITVQDQIPPVLSGCPNDVTVQCDAIPSVNDEMVTYTDNCDPTVIPLVGIEQIIPDPNNPNPCIEEILILRTWEATDDCGNTASCTQLVSVIDTTDPVFTFCPPDATVNCEDDYSSASTGFATADDNCSMAVDIQESDNITYNGCDWDFEVVRTWTATDECDNSVTCSQTITVVDNVAPVVTFCPPAIQIECDQDTSAASTGIAEGDDLCSGMASVSWTNSITPGACTHTYGITRIFTLVDECGNSTTCEQTIDVVDTTPPDPACPSDEVVECDAIPTAMDPAVTDNCDPNVDIDFTQMDDLTGCGNYTGTITRTWVFTDDCGNTAECVQVLTVEDTTDPTWDQAMPADQTVNCQSVPTPPGGLTASDNCDAMVDVTFDEVSTQGADPTQCDYYSYIITRTWTATDDCGNETIHTQTITVQDVTAPTFTAPANIVAADQLSCGDEDDLSLTGFPSNIDDNCAPDDADGMDGYTNGATSWMTSEGYTVSFTTFLTVPQPFAECSLSGNGLHNRKYQVSRVWTVADPCGNTSTKLQTINIIDDTPPVITCPVSVTVECSDDLSSNAQGMATATDNCDDPIEIDIDESDAIAGGMCVGESVITRTWTATDVCGNISSCTQTITTIDTTVPDLTCPADAVVECSDDLSPNGQGNPIVSDNCDMNPMSSHADAITPGGCDDEYTITRTWTATDDCGNSTSCDQTITVQDTTAPTFDQALPGDVTEECDAVSVAAVLTFSDNCGASGQSTVFAETSTQGVDPSLCDYMSYTITRTWTATDECGNVAEHTQTVTVEDTTSPTFDTPQDWVANDGLECGAEDDANVTGFPTNIDDNCATDDVDGSDGYTVGSTSWMTSTGYSVSYSDVVTDPHPNGECTLSGNGMYYRKYRVDRTWTVTDPCGNTTTSAQQINLTDHTPPVITCPANTMAECSDDLSPNGQGEATATDNCDMPNEILITPNDVTVAGSCTGQYDITRTWTAEDVCGLTSTCVQTIEVDDTTPPSWDTPPSDDVTECGPAAGVAFNAWLSSYAGATASDLCSSVVLSTNGLTPTPGCGNTVVYTLNVRATDACGNFIEENVSFTIEDTTPPDLTCAADIVVECTDPIDPANTGMSSASDNCGSVTITSSDVSTPGACNAEYVITRTWTAEDECGLISTCDQTITVDDSTPPVIACPANVAVECSDDLTSGANGVATATDNCDPAPVITESDNIVPGLCDDAYTIERTWTATDECGNATSCIQEITVDDTTDPVITCAADVTIECDESTDPANTGSSTATDNCDMDVTLTYMDASTPGACPQEETITRTWTATDNCGNTATCDQTIEIEDTTPPVFTTPAMDEVIECDLATNGANFTAWLMSYAGAVATDNCGSVMLSTVGVTPAPGCGNTIVYTVTIRATDECGNFTDDPATFTIEDTTAPTWDDPMPADATVECDAIPVADVFTASDACDNMVDVVFSETSSPGACPQEQTITRTWTATDDCGNAITHVQVITVEDSTSPTFTAPPTWTGADGLECGDEDDLTITGFPTNIDDNCADDDVNGADGYTMGATSWMTATGYTISFSDAVIDPHPGGLCSVTSNGYFRKYRVNRTWTVTDPCGNSTTSVQEINITDHTPPVITCPADVIVECSDDLSSMAQGVATATDNCGEPITITEDDVTIAGLCDGEYTIERTWTAEDECGQTADCVQTLTVEDNTPPVFDVAPMDMTIECDLATNGTNLTNWLTDYAGSMASDLCSAVTMSTTGPVVVDNCGETVEYTYTFIATDDCGNAVQEEATFSIIDTTVPTWDQAMPADVNVECTSVPAVPTITASDLCDAMVDVVFTPVSTQGADPTECDYYNYTITRTWVATDDCSNAITHTQVITVEDTTDPTFTVPANILAASQLGCGDENDLSLTGFPTTIADNCAPAQANGNDGYTQGDMMWTTSNGYTISFTTVLTAPQPWAECSTSGNGLHNRKYHYTRTWTVEDPCGNATTANQTITIIDDTPPVWDQPMPADETVECDNIPLAPVGGVDLTATDDCDGSMVTYIDDEFITPGGCTGEYTITRTWTAEDVCGNAITHTQTITVEDTTIPVVTCAADVVIECDEDDQPANTGMTTAVDNCDPSPAITFLDNNVPGACPDAWTIERTWTISDDCGNSTSCLQTITVEDTTPPVITCPSDVVVECSDDLSSATQGVATATDNCDMAPVVAESDNVVPGACPNAWTIERIWTATDACGNNTSCMQTITVEDTTPPTFDLPADIVGNDGFQCGDEDDLMLTGIPDNIDDNCAADNENGADGYTAGATTWMTANGYTVSFSDVVIDPHPSGECSLTGNGLYYRKYRVERTWSVTDPCGNTATALQTINITDHTPPVWDQAMPADATVECDAIPVAPVGGVDLTAMDNCDDPNEITYTDDEVLTPGICAHRYTLTRTWIAEDVCGNAVTHTQVITVEDTTPPTFTVPADATIQADATCMYDADPSITGDVTDEADNCDMSVDATYTDDPQAGACTGQIVITRTWTATDDCGNSLTQIQMITVLDEINPVLIGCPMDETISCLDPIPAPPVVTASDNCDPSPMVSGPDEVSTQTMDGSCTDHSYTITRTWTATDGCGNSTSCEQTITVEDTIIPVITLNGPASIDLCVGDMYNDAGATAMDDCFGNLTADIVVNNPVDVNTPGTYIISYDVEDPCGNQAVQVTRTVIVHDYPLLETSILGVVVTSNNDGMDDIAAPIEVCNAPPGNILFDSFIDLNAVPGNVRAWQTVSTVNATTGMCNNCSAPLAAFAGAVGTTTLIDPSMDGSLVMRFRAWLDLNSNNQIDPGECAGDWIEYTFIIKAEVNLTCANDTTVASCQDQATVDQAFADWLLTTTFTGGKNPVLSNDNMGAPDACGGSTVVTWTVTSDCEADVTCTATFIVTEDDEDPVLTCPADLMAQCNISEQPAYLDLNGFENAGGTATDNCDVDPNSFVLISEISDNNSCPEIITRTYGIEDLCGNSASCVQTITVDDTIDPTLDDTPADLTVECDAVPVADVITGSDNCDPMVDVSYNEVQNPGLCPDSYTLIRTWTAEDDCGNTVSHVQTITVLDTTLPTWDQAMPADETVECDAVPVAPSPITASDNCDAMVDISYSEVSTPGNCPDSYTLTRTWTATDNCGNSTVHAQTITVEDTTAPTLLAGCPTDETIECDVPVPAAAVVTAEDNCDMNPTVSLDEVTDLSGCGGYTGTITRTWTAEDACGNSSDICVQVITVEDTTAPTLLSGCPADETIECDDPVPAPAVVNAEDNCDIAPVVSLDEVTDLSGCGGYTGTITRTWTAEDACGNSAEICTQVITIQDTEIPAYNVGSPDITIYTLDDNATCPDPADISLMVDQLNPVAFGQTPASFTVHGVTFETPNGAATDNCTADNDLELFVWAINDDFGGTADACQRTIRVTYRLYDQCGNFRARSQDFIIIENTPPDIACPADVEIQCDDDPSPANTGSATATDNCDADPTIGYTEVVDLSGCGGYTGTITRTWTAEDECTNVSTCTQVITVVDTEAPTLLAGCPADETIECDDPVPAAAVVTAQDNCDLAPMVTLDEATDLSGCGGYTGTITRTWTAEDACGNSSDICVQVITVEDTTPPTFTTPADITIQKDVNCDYDADPSITGEPTDIMDNCSVGLVATYADDVTAGTCEGQEVITRTWTVEDDCGNITTDIQVITAVDEILPDFPLLDDVTIYTLEDGATCPTVADIGVVVNNMVPISSGNMPFQFTIHGVTVDGPTIYSDNCSSPANLDIYVVSINPDFNGDADECQRVIRIAYRVFDDCGNFVTRQQFFTVLDNTPPTFTVPVDITIFTDNDCEYDADPLFTGDVTDEADNCSTGIDATYSDEINPGTCEGEQVITRTWTLEDNCGNSVEQTQTITVQDNTPPTFTVPANITIEKDVNCQYDADPGITGDVTDEADNCTILGLDATYMDDVNPGACEGQEIITRTWFLEDDCGNSTTQVQTITAVDLINPTFPKPDDVTIYTDDGATCPGVADIVLPVDQMNPIVSGNAPFNFTVHGLIQAGPTVYTDNCSLAPDLDLYIWSIDEDFGGTADACMRAIRVIYRVYDDCGNFQQRQQTFTIIENTDPTFTVPADITIYKDANCNYDADPSITGDVTDEDDNCATGLDATYSDSVVPGACEGEEIITRSWFLEDGCGNDTLQIQTITVQDNTPPTFTVPDDITIQKDVNCQYDADPSITGDVMDEADNCTLEMEATYSDVVNPGNCEGEQVITRTWHLEDDCGNTTTQVQTITAVDQINPIFPKPDDQVISTEDGATCPGTPSISLVVDQMMPVASGNDPFTFFVHGIEFDGPTVYSDNCSSPANLDLYVWNINTSFMGIGDDCDRQIQVIFRVYDDCGNFQQRQQIFTISDDTPPDLSACTVPLDGTVECNGPAGNEVSANDWNTANITYLYGCATDNCTQETVTSDYDFDAQFVPGCGESGTITVTYTVSDECGNETTTSATLVIEDTSGPDVTGCPDLDDTFECDGAANNEVAAAAWDAANILSLNNCATDSCGTFTVSSDYSYANLVSTCGEAGILTVVYTLEDECMNTTTVTAVFTIEDNVAPMFTYEPADITINCEDSQDPLDTNGPAEASDVCDANPDITHSDNIVQGACPDSYVIERTWIATDDCTNSGTYLQLITVQDIEKPVYNLGTPDVTISTQDDGATCPAVADISLVVDQNNPIAAGHVTVPYTVHGVTFMTPNGNGTDNCTPDDELKLYVWEINEDLFNDADACQRTIEVTFRLFDRCDNWRQRKQSYTVIENTPPVITCPADVTIDCNDDPFDLLLTGEATATDNCDPAPMVTYGDVNDLNGCSMTGTITRTWMAEDVCANTTNCTQIITVQDVDPPVLIQCDPATLSMTFECVGAAGNEVAADAWNAANIAALEICAYDSCGVIVVTSNYDFTTLSDGCGETGSLVATYTVTDECMNTSTITGTFTVVDNTVPDLTGCDLSLLNDTHECDGDAGNSSAASAWNMANVSFLQGCVTDLCGTVAVTHDFDYANLTDGCGITGQVVVTYTLTDECGNSTTATGTFTVEDTTNPTWDSAMPVDVTVECDAVPAAFVAAASDGCDTDVDVSYDEVRTDGFCEDTYILTRTWVATDDCNNAITHTQQIQVQDTTDPNPVCQDREIFLDENGIATITPQEVDNGSDDNCDMDVSLSLSKTTFDCDDEGPNVVTLTVTDNCGNNDACTATVTVTDAIPPTAKCKDVTVFLDQNGQGNITPNDVDDGSFDNCGIQSLVISQSQYNCTWIGVSTVTLTVTDIYDNVSTCTANVTVIDAIPPVAKCKNHSVSLNAQGIANVFPQDIENGSTDNCSIASYVVNPTQFDCDDIGSQVVVLTVTDFGGNSSSCAATVMVSDPLPPVMACKDLTVFINAQGDPITIFPNQIDAGSQDNCDIVSLTLNKTVFDCSQIGQNVVSLVAVDQSGNTNSCPAIVTVVDAIPPVWTYMPGDITVNCIDVLDDEPEAADNCGGVNIQWSDVQEFWPAGPVGSYLVRRTWTAFDASGNEISYEQVVYVLPGGELLINCTQDIHAQPTHFPIKVDWPVPTVDDICEGSVEMVQIGGPPPLSYFNPGSQTLITYEHVDAYGTHYQCSFWVFVPQDGSGYIVVLNEVDCEDLSLTDCEVKDLPSPDNYSFEYILPNMAPIPFDIASGGRFEMFADGSAHLTGSWSDFPNTCGWDMDIWFHRRRTHDGWVAAGGDISAFSGLGDPTLWEFFEVDATRSKMSGTGCYTGQNYNVRISPNFPKFGFQLGEGANTKTNAYGGWVILGITNQSDQLVAQGIFSFELDCTTTNLIKDAAEVISLDGFDYPVVWSTGTTGPELGDVPPGMYDVTVTDQVGNTQSSDFDVVGPKDCILYYENDCRPGNMTENALVKQSSTFQGAVAERAVDQNTDGDFANGSVSSTLAGYQNYLSLSYIEPLPIEKIRIWNRTDCCGEVLNPFYLFVSEAPIPDNIFPEDLVFYPEITAYYHDGPLEDSYTFDVGEMGQYIKVQLAGSGRLMLAEVQVLVCQEDAIGLQDDGFTQPDEDIVIQKPEPELDDVPTVAFWPNPANNYLEIDITQQHASPMGLTIVNMQGVEVYRAKLPADHLQHLHIDTGDWGPGIYFMTISSANGARSLPLTIQH